MPKEYFYPDSKEPHIHVHKGGITFTDTRHSHKKLRDGDQDRRGAITEVLQDLTPRVAETRIKNIVDWINTEF